MAFDSASSDVLGLSARVTLVLAHLAERRRRQAIFCKTHAELSAMADRDLADIGVRRGMIDDIARDAVLSSRDISSRPRRPQDRA